MASEDENARLTLLTELKATIARANDPDAYGCITDSPALIGWSLCTLLDQMHALWVALDSTNRRIDKLRKDVGIHE